MVTREDFLTAVVAPIGNGWALRRHIQSPHADEAGLRCELLFPAFDYARIAAISGWMPMMFITRVRL
jgi:hypothetical protein